MELEFQLTKEDIVQYNLYHFYHDKNGRRGMLVFRYLLPIAFAAMMILTNTHHGVDWLAITIALVLSGVWIVANPWFMKKSINRSVTRMLREGKNQLMLARGRFTFTEEGIISESAHSRTEIKWDLVEKAAETKGYIYIYTGAMNAFVIPQRAFESGDKFSEFGEMVRKKIKNAE